MSRRLTDAELREPDVVLSIPLEKWARLPADVVELLRLFVVADRITIIECRLPAYRWREVQQMTMALPQYR